MAEVKQAKVRKKEKSKKVVVEKAAVTTEPIVENKEEAKVPQPAMIKKPSRRFLMLGVCGFAILVGIGSFIGYFISMNMIPAFLGVIIGIPGVIGFIHYWKQESEFFTEQMPEAQLENCNTLCIYRNQVQFEEIEKPQGFPWTCKNDGRKYYVMIYDLPGDGTSPQVFGLPDQQYRSPEWFAERPISLPAHRKLFTPREKLGQIIKTALIVLTIVVVWILIVTTTGG